MSILRDLNRAYPTGGRIAEIPQAGIAGSLIPSDGVLGNDITLPADNAVLFRAEWLTTPSSGVFRATQDGAFELTGAADGTYNCTYQRYRDGVADGAVDTVVFLVGTAGVSPGSGTVAVTGNAPTIGATSISVLPGTGTIAVTGNAPTVGVASAVSPGTGTITVTGNSPSVGVAAAVSPGTGSIVITGNAPVFGVGSSGLTPTFGAITFTGNLPVIGTVTNQTRGNRGLGKGPIRVRVTGMF